jgi:hypothetical protein
VPSAEQGSFLDANLAALSARDPELARALRSSTPDPSITVLTARNGSLVPAVHRPGGRAPLHSLYDPERESRRLVESARGSGCLVFLGLGAGFHVAAALEDPNVASVLIFETNIPTVRALLQNMPLARVLGDARVRLLTGLHGIRSGLFLAWQPALMGTLQTVALRSWCEMHAAFFKDAVSKLRLAIEEVRSDYGVQAHFGKRWFSNMLLNLEIADRPAPEMPFAGAALVTAAGPSLERQRAQIAAPARGTMLIASDTSLPALIRWGATPDAVISVDCQNYSYHHFLQGIPGTTTIFLDLASPPFLARNARRLAFITSGNPFSVYIDSRWRHFPRIDTSGGNVAHAAVSLARHLGARKITLFGADFSYPHGKPYSRGTYLYDFFDSMQDRTSPTESRSYSFLFRSPDVRKERFGDRITYTTALLGEYRERMVRLMQSIDAEVIPAPGDGLDLPHVPGQRLDSGPEPVGLPPSTPDRGWREFLADYAQELAGIDPAGSPIGARYHLLDRARRELWETILPVAARVIAEEGEATAGAQAFSEARRWVLARISRVLGRHNTSPYA